MGTPIPPPPSPPLSTQYLYPLPDLSSSPNPGSSLVLGLTASTLSTQGCHLAESDTFFPPPQPPSLPGADAPLPPTPRHLPLPGSQREPLVSTTALTGVPGGILGPTLSFSFSRSSGAPDPACVPSAGAAGRGPGGGLWATPSPVLPRNQSQGRARAQTEPACHFPCVLHLRTSLPWAAAGFSPLQTGSEDGVPSRR